MPWPLAVVLAVWCTELIVVAALLLAEAWGLSPLPPGRAWSEQDEADWRELLRQGEPDGEWRR
jgi:hypothetical protein